MITFSAIDRSLSKEITQEVARYVRGDISLSTFHSWFAPLLWNVEESGDTAAEELAYDIALRLSEYSYGQWSEMDLKGFLREFTQEPASIIWHAKVEPITTA